MRAQSSLRYLAFGFVILIIISSMTAVAAGNTVPSTRVDNKIISFNINHLSPSACSGLTLTALVTGSGVITGTTGNTLILASDGIDTITGMDSNDCILGGDGDDTIDGGAGNDVCVGGPGTDTFLNCETQIQQTT